MPQLLFPAFALPVMVWQMQLQAVSLFWSFTFSFGARPRPKLTLASYNPGLVRTDKRAVLHVVR